MNFSGRKKISVRPETKMAQEKAGYVGCFSLSPTYSTRELRRINYLKRKYYHGKRNPFAFGLYRSVPVVTQIRIKHAFSQGYKQASISIPSRVSEAKHHWRLKVYERMDVED